MTRCDPNLMAAAVRELGRLGRSELVRACADAMLTDRPEHSHILDEPADLRTDLRMDATSRAGTIGYAAMILLERGHVEHAAACCEEALRIAPSHARCRATYAAVLDGQGRFSEAEIHWEHAAALKPFDPWHRVNRAMARLRVGDFRGGWADYEERLADDPRHLVIEPASLMAVARRRLTADTPLAGRRVVVFGEQGLGDQVMFARFIPELARRGARVTVAVSAPVAPLIARVDGVEAVLSPPAHTPQARLNLTALAFDHAEAIGSLPLRLEAFTGDQLARSVPYIRRDQDAAAVWRRRLRQHARTGAPLIGLIHQAELRHSHGDRRSVPLAALDVLRAIPGVAWVNLQHGEVGRHLQAAWPELIDATVEDLSMDVYADLVAALDAVVTVDTLAAHIAGALAVPLMVVLPMEADWKWRLSGERSDWYPAARLYRQTIRGDWKDALDHLAVDIGRKVEECAST